MTMGLLNLDKLAAERAQAMVTRAREVEGVKKPVETLERLATKALGVLQEQGVYALMLFLFSRSSDEEKVAPLIRGRLFEALKQLFKALKQLPGFQDDCRRQVQELDEETDAEEALDVYTRCVLGDLDTLLLVRDLYEQTLIYTRFGAKAAGE